MIVALANKLARMLGLSYESNIHTTEHTVPLRRD